jgi:curli production assembly/transport component CsgG
MKRYLIIAACLILSSCTVVAKQPKLQFADTPKVDGIAFTELKTLKPPKQKAVVAVYDFPDLTGQRHDSGTISSLSSAVTQGGAPLLIDALKNAGNGTWFRVVERVRVDDLAKERQIVRQTREEYEGKDSNKLEPMLFAGLILQGGIVGYDSNVLSGGAGARYLGIGLDRQYRRDMVTVSLRAVNTNTGEIILNVQVSKTILSISNGLTAFKFVDAGTNLAEAEIGMAQNEADTIAVKTAIEAAVVELIKKGITKGYWSYE